MWPLSQISLKNEKGMDGVCFSQSSVRLIIEFACFLALKVESIDWNVRLIASA